MARIYTGIESLVGGTPLLALTRYGKAHRFAATVLAKLEYLNPAGSAKDRVGLSLNYDSMQLSDYRGASSSPAPPLSSPPRATRASAWPASPPRGGTGSS